MLYTFPDYYKEFTCVGTNCPDTCCACWQIVVDDKSLIKYIKYKGKFKKELIKNINFFNRTFKQSDDLRCKFLNDKNLCSMQLAMGEKALCKTCYNYPRHIEEFENVREISLSVSCPAVALILLSKKDKTTFTDVEKNYEEAYEDFDLLLYSKLCDARDVLINILQNREYAIDIRMQLAIAFGHDLQRRINKREIFSFEEVFEKYESRKIYKLAKVKDTEFKENLSLKYNYIKNLFEILFKLEHLQKNWIDYLNKVFDVLYQSGETEYNNLDLSFRKWCLENDFSLEIPMEQLLVYFVFTYFCGSVYDEKVYSKVFMSVISVFLIEEMIKAQWIMNNRKITMNDIVEIVYKYSRELEHSNINLELFERAKIH